MTGTARSSTPSSRTARVVLAMLVVMAALGGWLDGNPASPAHAASGRSGKGKQARRDFAYQLSDCQASDKTDSVGLELSEGSVQFHQILTMNCTAATRPSTVSVSYVKKGRDLQVTVLLKSDVLADCTCPIGIDGSITGLDKGAYRIFFFYEYSSGPGAKEKPVRRALGTKEFWLLAV